jgi:hypothetical protein
MMPRAIAIVALAACAAAAEAPAVHIEDVGYRIAKSYYQHHADKRRAVQEILEMSGPHAFLARSGWHPGIAL